MKNARGQLVMLLPVWLKEILKMLRRKLVRIREFPYIFLQPMLHKSAYNKVLEKAKKGGGIKVAFFVVFSSVWKLEGVYRLMIEDERFDPIIVVCPVANNGRKNMIFEMNKAYDFFSRKGHNVVKAYDEEKNDYLNVKKIISPDIVFYTNPYKGLIDKRYYITKYMNTLTCYVPYAFYTANFNKIWFDGLFQNTLWKVFYETSKHEEMAKECARNKGKNIIVTGYPGVDSFVYGVRTVNSVWLNSDNKLKRIIWAPHHTIVGNELVTYSNFIKFQQTMLDLANKYQDKIQVAFKPHPLLKVKLYNHLDWGKNRTDDYYNTWATGINTQLETDQYEDLFNSSDAMIFDSGSFTTEYLYCGKPSLFIIADEKVKKQFNEFGKLALEQHYHAYEEQDIIDFIDMVCEGKDKKYSQRRDFYCKYLVNPNGKRASLNIYENIYSSFF